MWVCFMKDDNDYIPSIIFDDILYYCISHIVWWNSNRENNATYHFIILRMRKLHSRN